MHRALTRWHPLIGLVAFVPVVLWALSGLTHPLMRVLRPSVDEAAVARIPWQPAELGRSLPTLPDGITALSLVRLDGRSVWRATTGDQEYWFDASTGTPLDNAGTRWAESLARAYSGETHAAVASIRRITAFDDEYGFINKLLPAWRVEFDRPDRLRIYVDAQSGQFVTAFDDTRARLNAFFRWGHTWSFLDKRDPWRIGLTFALMLLLAAIALSGLALYGLRWRARNRPALSAWHRTAGVLVSLSTLMFAVSGALHVLEKRAPFTPPAKPHRPTLPTAGLVLPPAESFADRAVTALDLVWVEGRPAWRLSHFVTPTGNALMHEHGASAPASAAWPARYLDATNGQTIDDGEARRARTLARAMYGLTDPDIAQIAPVTRFGGDYGFVNKRLPVVAVTANDAVRTRYYIDPVGGAQMTRADDLPDVERWTFSYLHKWHFLDRLGIGTRDAIISTFVAGNIVVAGLGVALWFRRRPARRG